MPKKRPDMVMQRVSFKLSGTGEQVDGVVLQALEYETGNRVDVQVKLDGTGELRWIRIVNKRNNGQLNAHKHQTCSCGKPSRRIGKKDDIAFYRCSMGHTTTIYLKGKGGEKA